MNALDIGFIFGGASEEHPISVKSAREVARNLDTEKYRPHWIGITADGAWKLCDSPDGDWQDRSALPAVVSPDRNVHGLLVKGRDGYATVHLDAVFPVLHGKLGEDGAVQGLLELSGIPYVGCDIQGSAVCMDKSLAYTIAREAGIATPTFWIVGQDQPIDADVLPYPVFVKPARSGSSFGVSKVTRSEDLTTALNSAREYDVKVVIEKAVSGREIGCAVMGEAADLMVGDLDRVALSHGFFRIHQEDTPESGSENSTFIVPADIPDDSRRLVQKTAKDVYRAMGCKGLARVDLFLTDEGSVVLNEVNTLPGLTSYSRYPRMMASAGLTMPEVIDRLITMTLEGSKS